MAEHCVPVCSPRYLAEHGPLRTPEDIRNCTLLHSLPRMGQWRNWLAVAGVTDVDFERGPKFHTTPLALEAAKSGLGVAIANREFVEDHIRQGTLVAPPFQVEVPSESGYYLVYPRDHVHEPKVEVFRDWLLATIAEEEADEEVLLEPV
jgi:LysR family glycine cleavage system transcriptional activator